MITKEQTKNFVDYMNDRPIQNDFVADSNTIMAVVGIPPATERAAGFAAGFDLGREFVAWEAQQATSERAKHTAQQTIAKASGLTERDKAFLAEGQELRKELIAAKAPQSIIDLLDITDKLYEQARLDGTAAPVPD